MRNQRHAQCDIDYAAYLVRVGCDTLEEALDDLDPRTNSDSDKPECFAGSAQSTDYFVFYQENGRWAWRRVNQAETVVAFSNGSFRFYLHCIGDAKQHGWKGRPVSLFSACGFSRCSEFRVSKWGQSKNSFHERASLCRRRKLL